MYCYVARVAALEQSKLLQMKSLFRTLMTVEVTKENNILSSTTLLQAYDCPTQPNVTHNKCVLFKCPLNNTS